MCACDPCGCITPSTSVFNFGGLLCKMKLFTGEYKSTSWLKSMLGTQDEHGQFAHVVLIRFFLTGRERIAQCMRSH
jgi:hypothetical protein